MTTLATFYAALRDMFMGTGSTGEACIREGREFIGIEKDRPSYVTAQRRLEAARMQPTLFEVAAIV